MKLTDLQVQSFVTLTRDAQADVQGGDGIEPTVLKIDLPGATGQVGPCGPPVCATFDCPTAIGC